MRILISLFVALILFTGCNKTEAEKSIYNVASFNIRYDNPRDGDNRWKFRKTHVFQFMRDNKLDIIGYQEVLHNQLLDLQENLSEYDYISVGRDDGGKKGEAVSIAFLKEKFEKLDGGTFWLSEYPDSIGSVGWDAALTRIASWGKLKDKNTGTVFMVVKTHFDHIGVEARRNSALLIISKIKEIVGEYPAIVMGDFNFTEQSDEYKIITTNEFVLNDSYKVAESVEGLDYTFHNFGRIDEDENGGHKIDFIFTTPTIRVLKSHIPSAQVNSVLYLTDHNPLLAEIEF